MHTCTSLIHEISFCEGGEKIPKGTRGLREVTSASFSYLARRLSYFIKGTYLPYVSERAFINVNSLVYQNSLQSGHYSHSPDEQTLAQSGQVTPSRPHSVCAAGLRLRLVPVFSLEIPASFSRVALLHLENREC